ncbi:hypothetical protein BSL78_23525 [Apostichopus japonicus]|uniref:Uncharacterized protein n=1 Tax=Stichopus japonicus TaxID=307972 RepID=A0A2G8JV53_STIJA|nr:hypothetical protein BSL78_23525 [Apostichopus japonicus]
MARHQHLTSRTKKQTTGQARLAPNPSNSLVVGDRAHIGEEEEGEVVERGPEGAEEEDREREKVRERWRGGEREKVPPTVPAISGLVLAKGKGKEKGKAPAKKKVPRKKSGIAGPERASQAGSQRNNPTERQVPRAPESPVRAPSGTHNREPAAGGSLTNQSRSRSGYQERQPIRPPTGIPDQDSRGRDTTHKPARRERTRSRS